MGDRARDIYPLPLLPIPTSNLKSPRARARACRRRRIVERTNVAIDALNRMYGATCTDGRKSQTAPGSTTAQQQEVIEYITSCTIAYIENVGPPGDGADSNQDMNEVGGYEEGRSAGAGSPAPLKSELISLPTEGGGFKACDYVGPQIAAFCNADPDVMVEPWLAELVAGSIRSGARIDPKEYAEIVKRLLSAKMAELTAERAAHPLGMFAVWKEVDKIQRLIIDGRPVNEYFTNPPFEFTSGEDLSRLQVQLGYLLQVAKCDLSDFFHCCEATDALKKYFGLKGVPAALLREVGVEVPPDCIDSRGYTYPRLTTLPMGFGPSPGIAQAAHEAVLYGEDGAGSEQARQLAPVVRSAARWSGQRVPDVDSPEASAPHALVIDDLLLFRQVLLRCVEETDADMDTATERATLPDSETIAQAAAPATQGGACASGAAGGVALASVLARYEQVGLRTKPSKVRDYDAVQDLLGYTLDHNVLRGSCSRYAAIRAEVLRITRCGWARPREVERLVGKITHWLLLHRPSLALLNAVYAFCHTDSPERPRRLWPSVRQELLDAVAVMPLVRSDLSRPVSEHLIQTDACDTGAAVVYTNTVAHAALRQECARPRRTLRPPEAPIERWSTAADLAARFTASVDPADWRVAVRCAYSAESRVRSAHINEKEAGALVLAVRWAARSRMTRRCRIVVQSDSAAAVCALRKGRSSRPGMRRQCRKIAALTLAHGITAEFRWVATDRNMADQPSRGLAAPGPCEAGPLLKTSTGRSARLQRFDSTKGYPGEGPLVPFWSPLLDGNLKDSSRKRYEVEVRNFVEFVRDRGDRIDTREDLDYWMAYYCHVAYTEGRPSKGAVEKALAGVEHWLPEFKPLPLTRRCVRGWGKLQPPQPAAPFPRDLVWACATLACLSGDVAAGVAMMVAYDCWLRISEVAGITAADVHDTRGQVDPVGRGVSVFLPETKTGRRQAVIVEDPAVDALLLVLARAQGQRAAQLFPPPATLRSVLARCLGVLQVDANGLAFVWHSFRHGGASRAYLRGDEMSRILTRGRWAVESSGRHYIQSGRQLLLAQDLPPTVIDIARRLERAGIESLVALDLRARLR